MDNSPPKIVLIGRTNVGKSTIFNRLCGRDIAIVSKIPGTTRDRRLGECLWLGRTFTIIDTAGLDVKSQEEIDKLAVVKAKEAIQKADIVLFVVDARDGLLAQDKEYNRLIRKSGKPAMLAINKIDSYKQMPLAAEFEKLGFKHSEAISAKTGAGFGDMLDTISGLLPEKQQTEGEEEKISMIKIAIIGKPNVGKSLLFNKIIGEDISIVSSLPHTTRDSQDVVALFQHKDSAEKYHLIFIDTAGIIKKRKIKDKLIELSIEQSMESIRRSNIVFLVVDAAEPITMQDKNLAREILENNKSLIFVVNKWDLRPEKTDKSDKIYTDFLRAHFPFLTWAPIIFVSAKTGAKMARLVETAVEIFRRQQRRLTDGELKAFLSHLLKKKAPPLEKGSGRTYIFEIKQIKNNPLTFEIIAKNAEKIPFAYRRFIQSELRRYFEFDGCGIKLIITEK